METTYEISLNLKTQSALESYASFYIGPDKRFSQELYNLLEGDEQISPDSVITIDLIRRENGIPYPLAIRHCSCQQLAENVKLITKELFKRMNLENG